MAPLESSAFQMGGLSKGVPMSYARELEPTQKLAMICIERNFMNFKY